MKLIIANREILKASAILIAVGLFASFLFIPATSASSPNWKISFSGTFTFPADHSFGFHGSCSLVGESSGSGSCEFSQFISGNSGASEPICTAKIDITSWDIENALPFPAGSGEPNDFFILSQTATFHPSSPSCFPVPTPPYDTGYAALAGHYNYNVQVGLLFGVNSAEYQVTVTHVS